MRSRVFVDTTTYRDNEWIYLCPKKNFEVKQNYPYIGALIRKEMHDVVTPQFRLEQTKGKIINSPKFKEELDCSQFASTYEVDCIESGDKYYRLHRSGSVARVGLTMPQTIINNSRLWEEAFEEHRSKIDLAITRAHANVDVSEMMLLATMGELPETLDWIRSISTRMRRLTNAFIRRREVAKCLHTLGADLLKATSPKGMRKAQKRLNIYRQLLESRNAKKVPTDVIGALSNSWLEYRYAIRPLIFDMQSAIKAAKVILARKKRLTSRGKEVRIFDDTSVQYDNSVSPGPMLREDLRVKRTSYIKASAGIMYIIDDNLDALSAILGIDQPISSMYELVPFSFILDWFIGVGEWLKSLNKSSGLVMLSSWITLTYCEAIQIEPFNPRIWNTPGDTHYWVLRKYKPGSSTSDVKRVWRYPYPPLPLLPSFDLKLDLSKILDIGFIIRGMLSGTVNPVVKRS